MEIITGVSCHVEHLPESTAPLSLICEMTVDSDKAFLRARVERDIGELGRHLHIFELGGVDRVIRLYKLLHALCEKGSQMGITTIAIDANEIFTWMKESLKKAGFSRWPGSKPALLWRGTWMRCRQGIGYDVHPIVSKRKLVLAGVEIESKFGLAGHSDADVICHAVIDAILGAAGLGDIGLHFPETDEFKGAKSVELLSKVVERLAEGAVLVEYVDITLVMGGIHLTPLRRQMEENLQKVIGAPISIKFKSGNDVKGKENAEAFAVAELAFLGDFSRSDDTRDSSWVV